MAEATFDNRGGGGDQPNALNRVGNAWGRVSPALVPILAVITALILTVPLMVITRGEGSLARGLGTSGTAYAALLEGSTGLALNPVLNSSDVDRVLALAQQGEITRADLLTLSRETQELVDIGRGQVRDYAEVVETYVGTEAVPDAEAFDALGARIQTIETIGAERLENIRPLLLALDEQPRAEVGDLAERHANPEAVFSDAEYAEVVDFVPVAADYDQEAVLDTLRLVDEYGIVTLVRTDQQLQVLNQLGLEINDADTRAIEAIYNLGSNTSTGVEQIQDLAIADQRLQDAGVTDIETLSNQLRLVSSLYGDDIIAESDLAQGLGEELPTVLEENLVIRRPGNRVYIHRDTPDDITGTVFLDNNTPEDTSDDVVDSVYLHLGNQVLLFFPASLEAMLTRAIPFIIAGLAVTLGFKAGLFNIGAEGQLYIGAILAAWVGFTEPFTLLPGPLHLLAVLIAGLIGGGFWGFIPGALKAFTGAHEVITTIMLNFIAIRLVDWLIKSTEPIILLDPEASTPRTPIIAESARLASFDTISTTAWIAASIGVLLVGLWLNREAIQGNLRAAIRPVVYALVTLFGGLFLSWVTVGDRLHVGFIVMIFAVWFVGWFLNRTTLGFELRTVGANPEAARYAGMSVPWNTVLALTLSGAIVGLAGITEISGVEYDMEPEFFAGLGFDAIAVALLARNNPRNMIPAGLLWASLLTGAGLMQVRADISIDLVRIIQALIIMFIAADAIIRRLWLVREATEEEKAAAMFSKGWGG